MFNIEFLYFNAMKNTDKRYNKVINVYNNIVEYILTYNIFAVIKYSFGGAAILHEDLNLLTLGIIS